VTGLLGFDSVKHEKEWREDNLTLLTMVGEMFVNALEHKRSQAIQSGQRQFLELLATEGTFSQTLDALVNIIEEQSPGMIGLILLLDPDGQHLHIGSGPNLPKDYLDSIEGLEIGPMVGSCGTASYLKQRVIVEDIDQTRVGMGCATWLKSITCGLAGQNRSSHRIVPSSAPLPCITATRARPTKLSCTPSRSPLTWQGLLSSISAPRKTCARRIRRSNSACKNAHAN
jgi:hypothetical protein